VETIHFLSESSLLVLTGGGEIRVLLTSNFFPGEFKLSRPRKQTGEKNALQGSETKKFDVELDKGTKLLEIQKSQFGSPYA